MKIIVGMSGGVDSTIAAYILKKAGYEVVGVTFNFVGSSPAVESSSVVEVNTECRSKDLPSSLDEISRKLNIKIISRDYHEEFYEKIITSFVRDYESGITPNPCALCNATMKFAKLLEVMKEEGADMVATGHYANITVNSCSENNRNGSERANQQSDIVMHCEPSYCIKKSDNYQKDQSYMLYRLSQEELSHIIFPLADMDKSDVRKLAEELGFPNAKTKDSQDVCFIPTSVETVAASPVVVGEPQCRGENLQSPLDYKEFIKQFELGKDYKDRIAKGKLLQDKIDELPFFKKGEFVDKKGNVFGFHNGIVNYTVGQRRGINIAFGDRRFVVRIDVEKNQVVLGTNDDLLSTKFKIYDVVFSGYNPIKDRDPSQEESDSKVTYIAKLRYRHEGTLCDVDLTTNECTLHEPVRAITPGQAAVFYDDEGRIMFGGRIAL